MSDTRFYRGAPAFPVAPEAQFPVAPEIRSRADLDARVDELERVVATLATLRNERLLAERPRDERFADRRDPVALTAALHPRGRRSSRNTKRRSSNDGTMAMRFVFFEPPTPR